ncbi:uncharacterized protein ColSpa_10477 [Colletotrichum spaethianum]|uniref:Uncharacterized protein n=1 Tax=Colletotrichum spaethianum TaxID=700344 RepID=A0AA37UKL9_9PEZI|nr:uncharacterized protein ColSpa_10477 [Colletotrichum spaethianum]GKT50296.1 hypothetical protein ColSpa_10477 [Colletotrichum spaethianum]
MASRVPGTSPAILAAPSGEVDRLDPPKWNPPLAAWFRFLRSRRSAVWGPDHLQNKCLGHPRKT